MAVDRRSSRLLEPRAPLGEADDDARTPANPEVVAAWAASGRLWIGIGGRRVQRGTQCETSILRGNRPRSPGGLGDVVPVHQHLGQVDAGDAGGVKRRLSGNPV